MPRYCLWLLVCAWTACAAVQPTTTTLTIVSGTAVFGTSLSVRATVNAQLGTIIFTVDGQAQQPVIVDGRGYAFIDVTLPAGSHTVGASYSQGDIYGPSVAAPLAFTVDKGTFPLSIAWFGSVQIAQPVKLSTYIGGQIAGSLPPDGTVTFSAGAPLEGCSALPLVSGVATCMAAFPAIGPVTVTASYTGDANRYPSTGQLQLTVAKVVAGVYLATSPAAPVWGSPVAVSALVLGATNVPDPRGTVSFTSGGITFGTAPIDSAGRASVSSTWPVGPVTVSAVFNGDDNYQVGAAVRTTFTVGKAPTLLAVSADPAQVGQPVTLRASATLASGTGAVTGTVDFSIGGKPVSGCTGVALSGGSAACPTSAPPLGSYALTGVFSGDANTLGTTGSVAVTVNKAVPSVYLASSPAAPVYGVPVTLSALVLGAQGLAAPTGTVTFNKLTTQPLSADGHAVWTSTFPVGAQTAAATYNGDANYQESAPSPLSFNVGKAPTVLAVSADPAAVGQPTTLRASVSLAAGTGTIGGTVDFSIAGKAVSGCTGVAVQAGAASCSMTAPQLGTYTLAGAFSGDANTLPGSAIATVNVNKAAPSIYLAATPSAPAYGAPVTLSALVLGAAGIAAPTGTVTFTGSGPQPLSADGHALWTTAFPLGAQTIRAVYSGDANYQASPQVSMTMNVAKAATVLVVSADPAAVGQPTTLRASVSLLEGSGAITGTVDFTIAGKPVTGCAGVAIANAAAACQTIAPSLGAYTLAGSFSGDNNTLPSSATATVNVNKAAPSIYLASAPAAPTFGATVTLNVLLAGAIGLAAPSGTVTFSEGAAVLATRAVGSDGRASLSSVLNAGAHTVVASYGGDANYQAVTSAAATFSVSKAATVTTLSAPTGGPFTALVTPSPAGAVLPTGQVQFRNGAALIGSAPLAAQAAGFAAVLAAPNASGSISAAYPGDANFQASTSDTVIVAPVSALVTLTSDMDPSSAGQPVTFTAAVTIVPRALNGPPTGSVTFAADGKDLQTVPLSSGQALFRATLPVGSHAMTARYSGDSAYPSAAGAITQVVGAAASTLTLTASPAAAVFGQPVTLSAVLGPRTGASSPSGSIQFFDGAAPLGSAVTQSGTATLTAALPAGAHSLSASWAGDGTWSASTATASQTVNKASTSTALSIFGGALLASVSAAAGTPTGTVRFLDAATSALLATAAVNGSAAVAPLPSTGDAIVAVYSGDSNFTGGISATLRLLSVANAASYLGGPVSADEMLALFAPDLTEVTAQIVDSAGVARDASVIFAAAAQANILLPPDLAPGPATFTVTNSARWLSAQVAVNAAAPGIFTADGSGQGAPAAQVIVEHSGGARDNPQTAAVPIDMSDSAASVYVILYGTGFRHAAALPLCKVGGQPATVLFSGAQGSIPGLDQVNVLLPAALKPGPVTLLLTVDGQAANPVTLTIR